MCKITLIDQDSILTETKNYLIIIFINTIKNAIKIFENAITILLSIYFCNLQDFHDLAVKLVPLNYVFHNMVY